METIKKKKKKDATKPRTAKATTTVPSVVNDHKFKEAPEDAGKFN